MIFDPQISEPFLFNPLKHHLGYTREFINNKIDEQFLDIKDLVVELKHLGTSVMDVYNGSLSVRNICIEVDACLKQKGILKREVFVDWAGTNTDCIKKILLSDDSQWILKFHENKIRFVHIFPARNSQHTFRVKGNTLKTALIYIVLIGKDLVTVDDLNKVRPFLGLSPIKDSIDNMAILEMIEILREVSK